MAATGVLNGLDREVRASATVQGSVRRRKKSTTGTRPSRAQAAESQAQALKDANLFTSVKCFDRREDKIMDSNTSQDHSSDSTCPIMHGPELTPHTADDI
ncbi:hypothetical protein NDU88_007497 [Pleurodeles waltl]|uniref:Uncharacterized protein n=1 Tax=Pleurodeles waltl TaxID=8319 RepID=A0AAV7SSK0_PLEWA|nr:hypothetical protein NDU88_007497 [Pleurodeles waltl]